MMFISPASLGIVIPVVPYQIAFRLDEDLLVPFSLKDGIVLGCGILLVRKLHARSKAVDVAVSMPSKLVQYLWPPIEQLSSL
jgi:hypothetical protein